MWPDIACLVMTRLLAMVTLLLLCTSVFVPVQSLDTVMFMADGYLWGSSFDLGSTWVDDWLFLLQPFTLLLTTGACVWCLATNRSRVLLMAVAGFQLLLVLAALHSWAVDGSHWWAMCKPSFGVAQLLCVVLLVASVRVHRLQPSAHASDEAESSTER